MCPASHTKMVHGEGPKVRFEMPYLFLDRHGKRFMDEHAGRKIKSDALFKVIGTDENYPIAVCDDSIVKAINVLCQAPA